VSKILVVDDIKLNCDLLQAFLEGRGHGVVTACNGAEALELARASQPDLIISDILMPVMDGFALCKEWKKDGLLSQVPFIFYTATYTSAKDETFALALGAERFLIKPMELKALYSIIEEILEASEAGEPHGRPALVTKDGELYREYNEVLIRKLEDKVLQLQESEEQFRVITENSADAIFITDQRGRYVYVNQAASSLVGYSTDELLTMSIADLGPQDRATGTMGTFDKLLQDGQVFIELELTRKDGSVVSTDLNAVQLPNGLVYGSCRDITERKKAEKALAHSHDLMRYVIEHSRGCVAVHDRDLNYIYVSQSYLDDYGVKEVDVIGKHHYDVFPDLPQKWRDVHQKALAGEILSAEEDPYVREDGTTDWTCWECRPWYEADGAIGGIVVYTELITERKEAEQERISLEAQLRQAQKLESIGTLASGVAHEINNPLMGTINYAELVKDHVQGNEKAFEYTQGIIVEGNRIAAERPDRSRARHSRRSSDGSMP